MTDSITFSHMDSEAELKACYPVMLELRTRLASEEAFIAQVKRQQKAGYRILAAREGGAIVGLAGYRITEDSIHNRLLYVDDLVVTAAHQRGGIGGLLLEEVKRIAESAGLDTLALDTGMHMPLAQRFYFRQGLLALGLHFATGLKRVAS